MAFESALVLSSLLCNASNSAQVLALLRLYNRARFLRTDKIDELSRASIDYMEMIDGPAQAERDYRLRVCESSEGAILALMIPVIQRWLWGFDAGALVEDLWGDYLVENPATGENIGLYQDNRTIHRPEATDSRSVRYLQAQESENVIDGHTKVTTFSTTLIMVRTFHDCHYVQRSLAQQQWQP